MLEEKNFSINETEDKQLINHHHHRHHASKSALNKKHQSKIVQIDNQAQPIPVQGSNIKCDYCGKLHCDAPNHPACLQQQKLCEEEQRLNQIKQQQYQQQQMLQDSRPNSQAFCKSTTPDFRLKNDPFNSVSSRSQQYTIQTGNTSFECTGAIR